MKIKVRSRSGQPPVTQRSASWPARAFRSPVFRKRSVRTLIKQDEAKGVTQPEFARMTSQKGVDTGAGFSSGAKVVRQRPLTPPAKSSFQKEIRKAALGPLQRRSRGT